MGQQRKKEIYLLAATRPRMDILARAKIFAPYKSLKGFEKLLATKVNKKEPKRELPEDLAAILDTRIKKLILGDIVEILYYNEGKQQSELIRGAITQIDYFAKTISIVKTKYTCKNILQLELKETTSLG